MKIAILFSGFVRNYKQTFPFIDKFLLSQYDCDTFFYGYSNGIDSTDNFLDMYKFKKFELIEHNGAVEETIKNLYDGEFKDVHGSSRPINMICQFYNLFQTNKLRKEYTEETGVRYDLVIRNRLDLYFHANQPLTEYSEKCKDENIILIPSGYDFKVVNEHAMTDNYAVGSEKSIDKYCDLFYNMKKYNHECGLPFHPESLMGYHISQKGLIREDIGHYFYTFNTYDISKDILDSIQNK